MANTEHQSIVSGLTIAIANALTGLPAARVFPGINVSDRRVHWEKNYRCPDVAVVLPGSQAIDCDAFFFGGPDFAVEVISDYDRSRDKFDFYARVGVRELLLVDRNPWQLELHRLSDAEFQPAGVSDTLTQQTLISQVLPLHFRLLPPTGSRPQIEVFHPATGQRWLI
jgi:Uma2 family endonuclease